MATNAKRKNLEHSDPSEVEVMRDKIRKLEATLETTVKAKRINFSIKTYFISPKSRI